MLQHTPCVQPRGDVQPMPPRHDTVATLLSLRTPSHECLTVGTLKGVRSPVASRREGGAHDARVVAKSRVQRCVLQATRVGRVRCRRGLSMPTLPRVS
jgi:hypothetical protein